MSPKVGGVLGVIFGVAMTALAWYAAHNEGKIYLFACLIGPAVLPFSIALVALPPGYLMRPKEVDGRVEYDTRNPSYTPLGFILFAVGLALGGLLFAYLKYGF